MAASPSITATLPQVGEQLRDLVFKTDVTQCPSCGRYMQTISKTGIYQCKPCRLLVTEPS